MQLNHFVSAMDLTVGLCDALAAVTLTLHKFRPFYGRHYRPINLNFNEKFLTNFTLVDFKRTFRTRTVHTKENTACTTANVE